jgi:integrase
VTIAKALLIAVESGYLESNPAHGVQSLLTKLQEPCRTIVLMAVLTGMRIGEIFTLRWNVDFQRGSLEISETYSNGRLGVQKLAAAGASDSNNRGTISFEF